jgi:hypothetical protein
MTGFVGMLHVKACIEKQELPATWSKRMEDRVESGVSILPAASPPESARNAENIEFRFVLFFII